MKLAHSNLLGELVEAREVEHADTAGFQIVCPCCAESVFKVARTLPDGRRSEFFSHRQAPPNQVTECELRVGSISHEALLARNEIARGQTLEVFRQWLRQALVLDRWIYGGKSPTDIHRRMESLEGCKAAYDLFRTDQVRLGAEDVIADELRQMQEGLDLYGVAFDTSFGKTVRERIVGDMLRHLLTNEGRANHAFLFRHTVLRMHAVDTLLRREIAAGRSRSKPLPEDVSLMLRACLTRNQRESDRLVIEANARMAPEDTDRFYRMVTMGMLVDLSRVPYDRMLENHRAGRSPLDRIPPRHAPDELSGIRFRIVEDAGPGTAP